MSKPEIRFNGFDGEWTEKKLIDICEINPHSELPKVFEYVDLESVSGTEIISHRTEFKETAPSRAQRLAKKGDVFYQTVRPYQKNNYFFNLDAKNYVFSTGYAQLRTNLNGHFLLSILQSNNFVQNVLENCTGTSYPAINPSTLGQLKVIYPSVLEQNKIGNLFSQIDSLISSTQKEHDKLVSLKKCMLQKMFPKKGCLVPEIRFEGFSGDWVETKFYNIGTVKSGYAFQSENFVNQGIPVIRITNIQDGEVSFDEIVYYSEFDIDKDFIVERGDILLAMSGATTGKIGVYKREESSYINQRVGKFIFNDETTFKPFYKSLFDTEFFMEQVIGSVATGAQPNIGTKNVENMIFTIPIDKNEQQKIGSYFQNLDNLISKQSAELEKLKNVKKTLLSKMFV